MNCLLIAIHGGKSILIWERQDKVNNGTKENSSVCSRTRRNWRKVGMYREKTISKLFPPFPSPDETCLYLLLTCMHVCIQRVY